MLGQMIIDPVPSAFSWIGQEGMAWLWQVLQLLLMWGLLSTLLVGFAGAWVALGRARRPDGRVEAVRRNSVAG